MKSFFLTGPGDLRPVRNELSSLLPSQSEPWVLMASGEDPIAYFNLENTSDGSWVVQADVSGRHLDRAALVLRLLKDLQDKVSGIVTDDNDRNL